MNTRLALTTIVLCLGLTLSAERARPFAQQQVFRSRTDLVQVDTVVVDKNGRQVHGLTADDFELFDSGKRQEIVALTEVEHDRAVLGADVPPPHIDVATNSGPANQRLVVVVLDDLGVGQNLITGQDSWRNMKDALGTFLHQLGGQAQMALIRTSGDPGVEMTGDPKILMDAVNSFQWILRERPPARTERDTGLWRAVNTLRFLSPNDGRRKVLLFVTERTPGGADPRDLAVIVDPTKTPQERFAAEKSILTSVPEILKDAIEDARRANTAIYVIDPRGATIRGQEGYGGGSGFTRGMPFKSNDIANRSQAALKILAAATGGSAVTNTDNFSEGVARIVDELTSYYVLGFQAPDPASKKEREIEIRVKRPGLEARHRRVYVMNPPETPAVKAAKKDPLLGLAHSPIPTSQFPLKLWATISPPAAGTINSRITLWLGSGDTSIRDYSIYVIDLKKEKQTQPAISRTLSGAVPMVLPLESVMLAPGGYQLRVAARSRDGDVGGSVYITLTVPDFATTPIAIVNPVLGTGDKDRRDLGSLPFAPVLDRTFESTAELRLAFDVWRRTPAEPAKLVVQILSADGAIAKKVIDTESFVANVEVPLSLAGLKPGVYILWIAATNGTSRAQHEFGFQVR